MRFMGKSLWIVAGLAVAGSALALLMEVGPPPLRAALENTAGFTPLEIRHPIADAVLPLNFPPPVVAWETNSAGVQSYSVGFKVGGRSWRFEDIRPLWRPKTEVWQEIKAVAQARPILIEVEAFDAARRLQARGSVRFSLARETIDYPLFYREVNLPFLEAVKDPTQIRWRFGAIDSGQRPPIVLEKLPVCGNCHSFDRKGQFLAMDVDYANSKGSYIITRTGPEMRLATSDIITWDDYRREEGQHTFGLLSQISPDGRYVLSTVKDHSVFVPRLDLAFSQLFFPLKGIIAVYDRQTRQFSSLPGANDPAFVQSNPVWSPDGQWIVFARTRAAELEKPQNTGTILLTPAECEEFLKRGKPFKYDLYRVPFNDGKGGRAEPLRGASANGQSNYFPKYSPDGQWIVFCQASNYMLLQADSQLYIIPAVGGEARRLGCNLGRMNSWHSWSPDGRWVVFSSKAHSDYTQLYLTRINERGEASPPVWLEHMVSPQRAANIPEFVACSPTAIGKIQEQFLDDYSFVRVGNELFQDNEPDRAIESFKHALELNPNNFVAHLRLGFLFYHVKNQPEEGLRHTRIALRLEPQNPFAHFDLGFGLFANDDPTNALGHLAEAVNLLPNGYDKNYNAIEMNFVLAMTQFRLAMYDQCTNSLETVLRMSPKHPRANYLMAMAQSHLGQTQSALRFFDQASHADPDLLRLPDFYDVLSAAYERQGSYTNALKFAEKASELATQDGLSQQAVELRKRADHCKNLLGTEPAGKRR